MVLMLSNLNPALEPFYEPDHSVRASQLHFQQALFWHNNLTLANRSTKNAADSDDSSADKEEEDGPLQKQPPPKSRHMVLMLASHVWF